MQNLRWLEPFAAPERTPAVERPLLQTKLESGSSIAIFDFFLAAGQVGEGGKVIGEDVGVLAEDVFPVDSVALDPTAKAIIEGLQLPEEELADLVHSVVSMKVEAFKPDPIHAG